MTVADLLSPTQDVFERVIARRVAAPDVQHGRLVHLWWSAPDQADRLVQVYVNGELTHISDSPASREAWLVLEAHRHHQIELLATDPSDAYTPMPDALAGVDPQTAPFAAVDLLRDLSLPIDARVEAKVDGGAPVSTPLFTRGTPRGGFGAVFGEGGFGYDASIGPGLGLEQLGYGPLGSGGDALRWQGDALGPGPHTLELSLVNTDGTSAADPLAIDFTTARLPDPPKDVSLSPELILTWN